MRRMGFEPTNSYETSPSTLRNINGLRKFFSIIMLLWDSGCRLNEVLSRNINHVQFDEYGATLIVKGKTGDA